MNESSCVPIAAKRPTVEGRAYDALIFRLEAG